MSKTKNTGLALYEARGPLKNLLDNLSGEHGDYWLQSLKSFLRKEETPSPPVEILEAVRSKNKSKEKIDELIKFFKSIPAVAGVKKEDRSPDYLLSIFVHSSLRSFSGPEEDRTHYLDGRFVIFHDFSIIFIKTVNLRKGENKIFKDFLTDYGEVYENIEKFSKALYDLGIIYEKYIPETPVL